MLNQKKLKNVGMIGSDSSEAMEELHDVLALSHVERSSIDQSTSQPPLQYVTSSWQTTCLDLCLKLQMHND